jgi:hypothetical protein
MRPAALLLALFLASSAHAESRPLYYERPITSADLDGRTLRELTLMRNTIFARAGQPFRKKWLREYFTAQPWYKPAPNPKAVGTVTALDRQNAAFIARYEGNLERGELAQRLVLLDDPGVDGLSPPEAALERTLLMRTLGKAAPAASDDNPLDDLHALDKLLTPAQLQDLSRRDLRILRNTVYARHGRQFRSQLLQSYFSMKEWYQVDRAYSDKRLTRTDTRNIALIRSIEDTLGGPLSEDEHKTEDGWMMAA